MTKMKAERLRRGWTLQELGYRTGIQAPELSKIERRLVVPYPGQRQRLAKKLGLLPEAILDEDENEERVETAQVG